MRKPIGLCNSESEDSSCASKHSWTRSGKDPLPPPQACRKHSRLCPHAHLTVGKDWSYPLRFGGSVFGSTVSTSAPWGQGLDSTSGTSTASCISPSLSLWIHIQKVPGEINLAKQRAPAITLGKPASWAPKMYEHKAKSLTTSWVWGMPVSKMLFTFFKLSNSVGF